MMPLLEGLDGVKKMSKSLDNYIAVDDSPDEMFGKIMSISDDLMWRYFSLLSFKSKQEVDGLRKGVEDGMNPRDVKFLLAEEIIARFHDEASASNARSAFIERFSKGRLPDNIPEVVIEIGSEPMPLANVLKVAALVASTSEGLRMIKQGAVRMDGERISDPGLVVSEGTQVVVQVGKRRVAKIIS